MVPSGLFFLFISLILLLLALLLYLGGQRLAEQSGLPDGDVIYNDSRWLSEAVPLYAPDLKLVGKPDYLVEDDDGHIIPVEVKSGRAPREPHEGHVLQLAAYCLLVEREYGVRPSHGILKYSNRTFAISYTPDLEADLLELLDEMHEARLEPEQDRSHNDWKRCASCGFRRQCDQRL